MRILHTADWHLGKKLEHHNRHEEQQAVMEEIVGIADDQHADAVLIAGDLFDQFNPPAVSVDLFYKTLKRLSRDGERPVIAIAGNHDSPDRIEAPDPLARECGIFFSGYPHAEIPPLELPTGLKITRSEPGFLELQLPGHAFPLRLLLTPYANEQRLKTFLGIENDEKALREVLSTQWQELAGRYCDTKGVNILMAHLFFMKKGSTPPAEPEDEKPVLHIGGAQPVYTADIPSQIQYTALGHLHRYQVIDDTPCPAVYSSSPLEYSFGEAHQQKYVSLVDIEPGKPAQHQRIPLQAGKKLIRKKFDSTAEAVEWLEAHQNTLMEITIKTRDFLTAADRKQLHQAHPGIITIIPEVMNQKNSQQQHQQIDLTQDVTALFKQYFEHKYRQAPNEDILSLFHEICAEQPDS